MSSSDARFGLCAAVSLVTLVACGNGLPPADQTSASAPAGTAPVQPNPEARPPSAPAAPPTGQPQSPAPSGLPDPSLPQAGAEARALSPLAIEAIGLAKSADKADHTRLGAMLQDKAWLDRLDPPQVALSIDPRALQLVPVLRAVAAHAPEAFDPLASSAIYRESDYRLAALILASGSASRPGPALVDLWRSQLDPEADELETTIVALVESGSSPSLALLQDAFASDAFEDDVVVSWFFAAVLTHRQDEALLAAIESLLRGNTLNPTRAHALVESLFEYRPNEWYVATAQPPAPPDRSTLTPGSRARLHTIAALAARAGLIEATRHTLIKAELAPPLP